MPVEVDVPFRLAFYLFGVVEHRFGLSVGCVFAGIPHAVAVVVGEKAGVVGSGADVVELCRAVDEPCRLHHGVLRVEQLHHDGCVGEVRYGEHQAAVLVE